MAKLLKYIAITIRRNIQSVKLDGVEWDKSWFSHEELMKGNKLEITMGVYPNKDWASQDQSVPPSFEIRK